MKKIFLCLAILALLGSNMAFARGGGGGHGGGGHGGGGRGGHGGGGARIHGGGRGGHGGGRHDGGRRGWDGHHGGRHYHGGRWYDYNSGFYWYSGLWYPWWSWPYRSETDVVIWQETAPADGRIADDAKLDELEEQSYRLRQQQESLNERMRAVEEKQARKVK